MSVERQALADRFDAKAESGLLDVKIDVQKCEGASFETVCAEVNRLYAAVDRGEAVALDFRDSGDGGTII